MKFQGKSNAADFREMVWVTMSYRLPRFFKKPISVVVLPVLSIILGVVFYMMPTATERGRQINEFGFRLSVNFCFPMAVIAVLFVGLAMAYYSKLAGKNSAGSEITVDEQGIGSAALDGSQSHYYTWDQLERLIVSENLYTFIFKNKIAIFFNKGMVGEGKNELRTMIERYVDAGRVKLRG